MLNITDLTVSSEFINQVHAEKTVELVVPRNTAINGYLLLRSALNPKHTALVQYLGKNVCRRISSNSDLNVQGISPKDSHQCALVDSLINDSISCNIAIGTAGTGKTTLAMAYAINRFMQERKSIVLSKPTAMVGLGNAFGPVPGDIGEKYAPYLASYEIVLKKVLGDNHKTFFKRDNDLQFVPIELSRGCTYENCTFILDEAQNLTWHELNTIVSRMGEGTNMVILGDLNQIDVSMKKTETGLWKFINSAPFQESPITSAIQLQTQYRSPITKLVADVNDWIIANERRNDTAGDLESSVR